jgi:hypothetical protein
MLVALFRALHAALLIAVVAGAQRFLLTSPLVDVAGDITVVRAGLIVVAVLDILAAVGLLLLHRWGWVLAMTLTGASLAVELTARYWGYPDDLGLAINVVCAFYLNQGTVRRLVLGPGHSLGR